MKNKLKFLITMSLNRKIKSKWFVIANIMLAVAIVGITNIDYIINIFGGDFNSKTNIYVIDNTDKSYELFTTYVTQSNIMGEEFSYQISETDKSKEEMIQLLKVEEKEDNSIILIFSESEKVIDVEMISNEFISTIDMGVINSAINNVKIYLAIEKYDISHEQIAGLTENVEIIRTVLNENKNSEEENTEMIMTTIFPVVILPFFMLVLFLVQMIGAEVNDEKTTKSMEIIIANVSPKVHFFSKCIAGNLFILIQGSLCILYFILGFILRNSIVPDTGLTTQITSLISGLLPTSFISSLKYLMPLILILMILNFIGYSLLAAILASMTTNTEDFQQLQTPIMMLNLIGYFLGIMAATFEGSLFIKIFGYIPFISAILSPSLLVIGDFGIIDMFISMTLMIIVILVLVKYGLRIYKVGILNYSSGNLWKKMYKALKD